MIWVAEIGSAHGGDKSLAFEMIRQAKSSGATIAKFQFGWTKAAQKKYAGNYNEARYVDDWADELKEWCDHFGIELMASIWSMEGLETARRVNMKRYKFAHQFNDIQLITDAEGDCKTSFFSNNVRGTGHPIFCNPDYPAYPQISMPKEFGETFYGYSSHSHGIADALLAVARGAEYIEKHVTLDKTNPFPRDNSFAITFEEFATMVRLGDEMARLR